MNNFVDLYHEECGEIWGLIAFGHDIRDSIFLEEANNILIDNYCEIASINDIERLWAYDEDDTDWPTYICDKSHEDSYPVTVILEKNIKYIE